MSISWKRRPSTWDVTICNEKAKIPCPRCSDVYLFKFNDNKHSQPFKWCNTCAAYYVYGVPGFGGRYWSLAMTSFPSVDDSVLTRYYGWPDESIQQQVDQEIVKIFNAKPKRSCECGGWVMNTAKGLWHQTYCPDFRNEFKPHVETHDELVARIRATRKTVTP